MGRPKGALNKATLEKMERKDSITLDKVSMDGWSNFMAGIGNMRKDKTQHTMYAGYTPLDDQTLAEIYAGEGLANRIISSVADDMTREWGTLEGGGAEVIEQELIRLEAESKYNEALKWQRLFGGSLLMIGAMDGQKPDKPLNLAKVRKVEYLKVIARTDIPIGECVFETNPESPDFGKIVLYKVNMYVKDKQIPMLIHHSRVIPFYNDPIPPYLRGQVDSHVKHWGLSSLQPIYESIRDLGGINQSVANILYEFIIGKIKVERLGEMLASGKEGLLTKRMELINATKSTINAVILGENEEYTRDYASLAGLPEMIDRFMLQLSGSTGIPVTRLFGRAPAGLNATGENDLRNYYDIIEANQRNRLFTPINTLIGILSAANNVKPPKFTFNSLYQMTELEYAEKAKLEAETEKIKAETEHVYVTMGTRESSEIRKEKGWAVEDIPTEPEEGDDE